MKLKKECQNMAEKRFVQTYSQGIGNVREIIVDTQTGVNYLLVSNMEGSCGMTVLVDKDGKPIVTPVSFCN